MATVQLDPQQFVTAAEAFREVSHAAARYHASAELGLSATGGMAGDDASGQSFSASYDSMAASVMQAIYDVGAAAAAIDRGLTSTASVHAQVEAMLCGRGLSTPFALRPSVPEMCVAPPPVSWGGDRSRTPESWSLVEQFIAVSWPNADPDALRAAGRAWGQIADDLTSLARLSRASDAALWGAVSSERTQIDSAVENFALNIESLASYARLLSAECDGHAAQVDSMRAETALVIAQLVIEVALTIGIGAALSAVTFGVGAAVGAGIATSRLVAIGARITAIIQRLGATASAAAGRITQVSSRLFAITAQHPQFLRLGHEMAVGAFSSVAAEGMFRGSDTNYVAAGLTGLSGGLLGGAVGLKIAGMVGARSLNLLSQSGIRLGAELATGAGDGALGAAIDGLVREGQIDLGQVAIGAGLGAVIGGALSAAGGVAGRTLPPLVSVSESGISNSIDLPSTHITGEISDPVSAGSRVPSTTHHVAGEATSPSRIEADGDSDPDTGAGGGGREQVATPPNAESSGHDTPHAPTPNNDAAPTRTPGDHTDPSTGSPADGAGTEIGDPVYAAEQGWAYDIREPELVHRYSTHNPDSSTVLLGKYEGEDSPTSYQNQAKKLGHTYFSTPYWSEIMKAQGIKGDKKMFEKFNVPFLEAQAAQGKAFMFSHLPANGDKESSLAKEILWLTQNGYTFDRVAMRAYPTGAPSNGL